MTGRVVGYEYIVLMLLLMVAACAPPDAARRGSQCIAPAAAGGGWDLTCRVTGRILTDLALVPGAVPTINVPGAGGGVAFAHAGGQRDDDPTVLAAASPAPTLRLAQGPVGPPPAGPRPRAASATPSPPP